MTLQCVCVLSERLVKGCLFVNVHCWSLSSFISLEKWAEVACVYLYNVVFSCLHSVCFIELVLSWKQCINIISILVVQSSSTQEGRAILGGVGGCGNAVCLASLLICGVFPGKLPSLLIQYC